MPRFEHTMSFRRPCIEVFDFFQRPANLIRVSPPELHMQIVEGPERLQLGSRLTLKGRRWGIPHRIVSEVVAFEAPKSFTDELREGPFKKWVHTHRFMAVAEGTQVEDTIDFEPPGGALGLLITESFILQDLDKLFHYRAAKLRELLGEPLQGA
jgi:ligand-binding SRPBCC domain-containing protein